MASSVRCQLCNEPVTLENARINELGKAVHEECYLKALQITESLISDNSKTPYKKPDTMA